MGRLQALHVKHLHDGRPGERDPDSLVFAHQDGRHDLAGFGSVEEGVLQSQEVRSCRGEESDEARRGLGVLPSCSTSR